MPAAALDKAGVAAAVLGEVAVQRADGTAPAAVQSGLDMFVQDTIDTAADARLQVLLLDETVFTVGPNSSIVIDEFVYDPERGTGAVAADIARGVFRYVSGRVGESAPENVEINVPGATIGIRGTQIFGVADPSGEGFFVGLLGPAPGNDGRVRPGGFVVHNEFGETEVLRAGFGTRVAPGRAPGVPERIPLELLADLRGRVGLGGGAGGGEAGEGEAGDGEAGGTGNDAAGREGMAQSAATTRELANATAGLERSSGRNAADATTRTASETTGGATTSSWLGDVVRLTGYGAAVPDDVPLPLALMLKWEGSHDLDLHLTAPDGNGGRAHVYYGSPGDFSAPPFARLDNDSTYPAGVGSEVIAVNGLNAGGAYNVYVHDYGNYHGEANDIVSRNANVAVITGGTITRTSDGSRVAGGTTRLTATPPAGGSGVTWKAVTIDPATNVATALQSMSDLYVGDVIAHESGPQSSDAH